MKRRVVENPRGPQRRPRSTGIKQVGPVAYRSLFDLRPAAGNARKHPQTQIDLVAVSIRDFGFLSPLLIDEQDRILAGHCRLEAAKQLGMDRVPTVQVSHLNEAQKRAYRIADNRLSELAVWDEQLLANELKAIQELSIDFDLNLTGFDSVDVDRLLDPEEDLDPLPEKNVPTPELDKPPVSRLGDIWQLGASRQNPATCAVCRDEVSNSPVAGLTMRVQGPFKAGVIGWRNLLSAFAIH